MKINPPQSVLVKKIPKYIGIAVVVTFLMFFVLGEWMRISAINQKKLDARVQEQIVVINNTHLAMSDVMGTNLPPAPGVEADKTVAGIDANNNGIRDDVELAIFKEYPTSAKTRAVLLQYALALQMEVTQPFLETGNATTIIGDKNSAALNCIWSIVPSYVIDAYDERFDKEATAYEDFIKNIQFDTPERISARDDFYKKVRSYAFSENECDIELETLPN